VHEHNQDKAAPRQAYTIREACRLLHISESHGHQLIKQGYIEVVRLGEASPRITQRTIDRVLTEGIPSDKPNKRRAKRAQPSSAA